jgi:enoyl-CoA hydratase/carnithine racemase
MTDELVVTSGGDSTVWLTFDGHRPFDGQFWNQLGDALERSRDADIIVLNGGSNFSSGNSMVWMSSVIGRALRRGETDAGAIYDRLSTPQTRVADLLHTCEGLTVAVMSGNSVGAGVELSALVDLRVCTSTCLHLELPESKLGIVPDLAPVSLLNEVMGPALVRKLLRLGQSACLSVGNDGN